MRPADSARIRETLQELSGIETVVSLTIGGVRTLAALDLDVAEHARRSDSGVGAITSTPLLHGLWLLPTGGSVRATALPDNKVQDLRSAPFAAQERDGSFERTYSPPGILRAVAFSGRCVERVVSRAARFTPIFQRFAFLGGDSQLLPRVECEAREWGVGIIALEMGEDIAQLVPADKAMVGLPSVYRWWVAELAYKQFLHEKAQAVSCAFGFSGPRKPAVL